VILNLDERFRIVTDKAKMNFILEGLEDVKSKETGEVVRQDWKHLGYHGQHLNHAIKQYVRQKMLNLDEECDVDCLIDELHELDQQIEKVVRKENITFELKKEEK
jgi:hypothetical protein